MNYFKKSSLLLGWAVFAISALVYLLTMEPTASLWDCSEFIATSYKMEVGHPPGAPLFMMINRIFTLFAVDPSHVAVMVNVASVIASALTIMFLFWTIAHLGRRLMRKEEDGMSKADVWAVMGCALVGSLAYAFTDTFWFSAVEGEVYAQSSLFTALVFWAILKWENVADQPHANRWLILVAYLMGLSIGVHLLNLLAIPAIVFIYYYRTTKEKSKAGWWKAFGVSVAILVSVLYIIIPITVNLGARFDLFFVNVLSMPVNSGLLFFVILVFSLLGIGIWRTYVKQKVLLNTILLSAFVILLGYGTYASVVVRSAVNPPMNSNAPSDPYALLDFLNREQYGNRPLVKGQYYNAPVQDVKTNTSYFYDTKTKKYVEYHKRGEEVYDPRFTTIFPRMYSSSPSHIQEYKNWGGEGGKKVTVNNEQLVVPTFAQNIRYFVNYQVSFMYWRYFLWNFVGRQNDFQSQGEITKGNWLSGIKPIDELYLGPQDNLPKSMSDNRARNTYYFLPFILGLFGIFYQLKKDKNNFTAVMWLFFMTGIAVILYLNQPPIQPRERDYAFAGSFYAFSIWIGIGVMWFYDNLRKKIFTPKLAAIVSTVLCMSVPIILIAQNWDDHSRANRYVARDFGANYLNSTLPNSIIMPYGDNDTFPLWYSQEVEGVRPDVKVMNLSYLGADWYVEQMRVKSNDSEPVPMSLKKEKYYKKNELVPIIDKIKDTVTVQELIQFMNSDSKSKDLITSQFGDKTITEYIPARKIAIPVNKENAIASGIVKKEDAHLMVDTIYITLTGSALQRPDYVLLDVLANFDWKRPLYMTSPTASLRSLNGLNDYLQLDGFAYRLVPIKSVDSNGGGNSTDNLGRIDSDYLYNKLMNEFKFGNIKDTTVYVDAFVSNSFHATQFRHLYGRLAEQLLNEGDTLRAREVITRVLEEIPSSQLPHNYNSFTLLNSMSNAGMEEEAIENITEFKDDMIDELLYFLQFNGNKAASVQSDIELRIYYLQNIYALARLNNIEGVKKEIEEIFAVLNSGADDTNSK